MKSFLSSFLCLLLMCGGCGYSATRLLPTHYRAIFIDPIQNVIPITEEVSERAGFQTNLPGLEEKVTQKVIDQFLFDGNLRITTKPEEADLILSGKITEFSRQSLRRTDSNLAEEYRLNLVAFMTVRDREGKFLFSQERIIGDTTYAVSGSTAKSESAAVDDMVTDFARRVVERVIENW